MDLGIPLSSFLALLWLVIANVVGFFPSKKKHWPAAYVLMSIGLPIAIFLFYESGFWIGMLFLLAAGSIFRWPLIFLLRRLGVLKAAS